MGKESSLKIICEIPARDGSKRVKQKNLRHIDGQPLISYAIEAAKKSEMLDEVYVNSESEVIGQIALDYGIKFYKRDINLAGDNTTSDEFNYDFIKVLNPDILVMVNPVSPLIEGTDIDGAIDFFIKNNYDTVITVREEKFQAFCDNKPINFDPKLPLPRTQDLKPIQLCAWSICIWRAETFVESYEKTGHAVFSGNVGFYPLTFLRSIKISDEEDFALAESLLQYRKRNEKA